MPPHFIFTFPIHQVKQMSVIHNATFMMEVEREEEFINWFRLQIPRLGSLAAPRLSSMREAGGIDYSHAEAQSVAFQCEFLSAKEALQWRNETFSEVASEFMARFAPNAMVFTSIFEEISI